MAKTKTKPTPVDLAARTAVVEDAVSKRKWLTLLDLIQNETDGEAYLATLSLLGKLCDRFWKEEAWADAVHCYRLALWPMTHPPEIELPQDPYVQLMMTFANYYQRLPEASQNAAKNAEFWNGLAAEIIELAVARRFIAAKDLMESTYMMPGREKYSMADQLDAAADCLRDPKDRDSATWLLDQAGQDIRFTSNGQNDTDLRRLRDKREYTDKMGQAIKELREFAMTRNAGNIDHAFKTKYNVIADRLAAHFDSLGSGEDSDALEMRAIAARARKNSMEATRLREAALAARMRQADEWMASVPPASEDVSNWTDGIAYQQRLALAGKLGPATALLKRLKKMPTPVTPSRNSEEPFVDPRTLGALLHKEIAKHIEVSHPDIAQWFLDNAKALEVHAARDPDYVEPELADALPILAPLYSAGKIDALIELAQDQDYAEIASEIADWHETRATELEQTGALAEARGCYLIAAQITSDTHQRYRIDHIVRPMVEREAKRKIGDQNPPVGPASEWWTALDRVEHFGLAGKFDDAYALLSRSRTGCRDFVAQWTADWTVIVEILERMPRLTDQDEDEDATAAEQRWFESRIDWFERNQ